MLVAINEDTCRMSRGEEQRMVHTYDLVVLGAGMGGYVAAISASQLGLRACLTNTYPA